jgi:hypothetical protein
VQRCVGEHHIEGLRGQRKSQDVPDDPVDRLIGEPCPGSIHHGGVHVDGNDLETPTGQPGTQEAIATADVQGRASLVGYETLEQSVIVDVDVPRLRHVHSLHSKRHERSLDGSLL